MYSRDIIDVSKGAYQKSEVVLRDEQSPPCESRNVLCVDAVNREGIGSVETATSPWQ